jgi:hypothetical protein
MPMAGLSQPNLKNNEIEIRSGANFKSNDQETQNKDNAFKPLIFIEGVIVEFDKKTNFEPGMAMKLNGSDGIKEMGPSLGIISEKGIIIGKKSYTDLKALMEDLKMDSGIHILNELKIMSMWNKKASIEYGSPGTNPVIPATEKEHIENLSLEVTSHSQENGYIIQEIKLSVSQNLVVKTIGANVTVKDGNTLVIGPIQNLEDTKTAKNSSDKKDLYMFLTPHIIKTQEELNYVTLAVNAPEYKFGIEYDSSEEVGDIQKFVEVFSERTGYKYVVDEKIIKKLNGQKFNIRLTPQTSADECKNYFQKFLDDLDCVAVPSGDVIKIIGK